jgi:exosortase/archaeosortase family protein
VSSPSSTIFGLRRPELFIACSLVAVTAVVFWPAVQWLTTQAFAREQLKQSFILVGLAGLWIAWEQRRALRPHLQLTNTALVCLLSSYALAGGALLFENPLLFLAGTVAAGAGLVSYVLGQQAFRRTLPLLLAFAVLILCVLLFPILDWPLRQMAGVEAARFLKSFGFAPQLAVAMETPPRLLLMINGQTFHVATECNGFGLITSSLLLGLIRLLYIRAGWPHFLVLLPLCMAVAFVFNFLRISAIVLLAPSFPNNYFLLHEIAGLAALYSGLGVVWWLTGWRRS